MEDTFEIINGVYLPRITPERWEKLKNFPLNHEDIFIASYPKSGSTWMAQIVKLLRNGSRQDSVLLDRAIPWLEILDSDFGSLTGNYTPDMASSSDVLSPRAFRSHVPYDFVPGGLPHTTPAKYIYVMRNPKDVCVSYWHHLNVRSKATSIDHLNFDEYVANFVSNDIRWGGWCNHVLGWWKHKDAPNILFMKYENLQHDPHTSVRTVAEFVGIEGVTEELVQEVVRKSSFSSMKSDNTCNFSWKTSPGQAFSKGEFFRKGQVGDWKEHFSADQNRRFDAECAERLRDSDLKFDFV